MTSMSALSSSFGISSIIDQVIEEGNVNSHMEPIQGERNEDKYGKRNGKGDYKNT